MLDYLKKLIWDKKEYKQMMARVEKMPMDYQFVYKKSKNICGILQQEMVMICCKFTMN